jgi:hypothetical protein
LFSFFQVQWSNRFLGFLPSTGLFNGVTMAIDTTECPVRSDISALYSGYKQEHTLKYEAACHIATGEFVWAPEMGLLGPDADQDVFQFNHITKYMLDHEMFLGDGHYVGLPHSWAHTKTQMTDEVGHVRAIIEHAFCRLKQFHCLVLLWRHDYAKHHMAWKICVHVTNIKMKDEPLHKHPHELLFIEELHK